MVKYSERVVGKKTKAYEEQIESEIVQMLEQQCTSLGVEMENQNVLLQNQKIEIASLHKNIDALNKVLAWFFAVG